MGKNYNEGEFSTPTMFRYSCCPGSDELMEAKPGSRSCPRTAALHKNPRGGFGATGRWLLQIPQALSLHQGSPDQTSWPSSPPSIMRRISSQFLKKKGLSASPSITLLIPLVSKNIISKFPSESGLRRILSHPIYLDFKYILQVLELIDNYLLYLGC